MKFYKVGKNKQGYPEVSGNYVVVYYTKLVYDLPYSARHRAFNCYDHDDKPKYEVTDIIGWYPKEAFLEEVGIDVSKNKEYEEDDALSR